mmetsp:Transcript_15756/g.20805  ORF Transcript_15756/g.20805 Transcript_15756/m.20805 type:complete len:304 (+) Transcript_15756:163-1074(+)
MMNSASVLIFVGFIFFQLSFLTVKGFVLPSNGGLQKALNSRPAQGGRAPTYLQMNIADRFFRVAKANINDLLNKVEDPEKVLEQAVTDMQQDLVKVRQSYAEVTASCKRMEKQRDQALALSKEWYQRAELALAKDDDELAREALTRRQTQQETADGISMQLEAQQDALAKLYESMQALEAKISEAKAKKDQLVARARAAKTSAQVNDMLSNVGGDKGLDAFNRMEEKVDALESKAEVSRALSGGVTDMSLEDKFKALEGNSKVDDELAKMKGNLLGGTSTSTPSLNPAVDDELAQMKKGLNKE